MAAPATTKRFEIGERRLAIYGIGWRGYRGLLEIIGDGPPRLTYAHADVELMKPGFLHERYSALLGRAVSILAEELDVPVMSIGSTTLNREDRDCGLEFDHAYYLSNREVIARKMSLDLAIDPPPDLGIEVEIVGCELNRLAIAAGLEIPEVWRFDGAALKVFRRDVGGDLVESEVSSAFPFLPIGEVERLVVGHDLGDDTRWSRSFRAWVRQALLPCHREAIGE